ncbi:hypothetical protein V8G54_012199 [Vigna mungo]|uniref:S-protein homolog n=1 Tax=Vigna mungo TaxID=3915 RepID=A0AAQ3NU95_VIGMU
MIILCSLLVLLLQFKGRVTAVPILPTKVTVEITNKLNNESLTLHCKDKYNDKGVVTLNVNKTYRFRFYPNYFFPLTLYFCHFVWIEAEYYFNIYVQKRDGYCFHNRCPWEVLENGPCKIKSESRECFIWKTSYVEKNNTFSS